MTSKNNKLQKKIDKYKQELSEAKRDLAGLQSELQQTRQDKVIFRLRSV